MSEKDYFSIQAKSYARFRPKYPEALFDFIAEKLEGRELAWDCATGNGQVAFPLSKRLRRVIATDLSSAQIAEAKGAPNIEYRVAKAEASGLADASVDLVTVAQALHWFDLEKFWAEARRVGKAKALIAVWSYGMEESEAPIHGIVAHYYHDIVGPYWPPERQMVVEGYAKLSFPFERIEAPSFELSVQWSLAELFGYLESWSATQLYRQAKNEDPMDQIREKLAQAWGSQARRVMRWPLTLRLGRLHS